MLLLVVFDDLRVHNVVVSMIGGPASSVSSGLLGLGGLVDRLTESLGLDWPNFSIADLIAVMSVPSSAAFASVICSLDLAERLLGNLGASRARTLHSVVQR